MRIQTKLRIKMFEVWFHGMSAVEKLRYGTSLNVFDEAMVKNPYPHYNRMRKTRPIHYSLAFGRWWVTSYDLVQEVL